MKKAIQPADMLVLANIGAQPRHRRAGAEGSLSGSARQQSAIKAKQQYVGAASPDSTITGLAVSKCEGVLTVPRLA
jgi:hypothetical protein